LALYVVYPPELAGQVIDLVPGMSIGRAPPDVDGAGGSDGRPFAVLAHATVSRRHCELASEIIVPVLCDLGSSNGTKLNGVPLTTRKALLPQSVVRIGSVLAIVDERPRVGPPPSPTLPGIAPASVRAREALERAVTSAAPVVILGDTGTGKERVAAELHRRSGRSGAYVKFSCAELARELVESQLFGHERGAFTGASAAHPGLFAAADRGTLFLDEVGELPLELQAKLLRVLQEGEVRPLGSLATRRVDVRVIAATNRDLRTEVERGAFRRDLYARLSFFEVTLAPLRERRQDLLSWMEILSADFARSNGVPQVQLRIQPDVAELLLLHAWPENLRGLDRFVHRVRSSGETAIGRRVLAAVMPEIGGAASPSSPAPSETSPSPAPGEASPSPAFERPSREEFLGVYEATGRNVRATSKHFGRDRRQIYRWLELFEIER
jgi:transcriptional regulator with GAF, ATPase, and Fis domain